MKIPWLTTRYILPILTLILLVLTAFTGGFLMRPYLEETPAESYPLLKQSLDILRQSGLKDMPAGTDLEYGLIRGALTAYDDPYTVFVEPAQAELQTNQLEGRFGGIGARLDRDPQGFVIILPFPGSPAEEAGISEGERLLAVDGTPFGANAEINKVQAALRGKVGTKVEIEAAPPPEYASRLVNIERKEVAIPSTTWNLYPGDPTLGLIQVNIIAETTIDEIQKAVADLKSRGATRYALDLRNNGGGLLEAGVNVARLFLKDGAVITQQYRGRDPEEFKVQRPGALADIPLIVLVNHNTASAAEIIAGALQNNGRAKLAGQATYGKDTIQLVFELKDGSSLHVTAAHWWLPGREEGIAGSGLQPEWPVQEDPNNPAAIYAAALGALNGG